MPWTQKQMLRDANGDLIPQYWDVVEQEFKPLTGSDGANDVRLTGSNVEYITEGEKVPIPADTTVEVIPNTDVSMYRYIFVQVRPKGLRDYKVFYYPTAGDTNTSLYQFTLLDIENTHVNQISELHRTMGLKISVRFRNDSEEDHNEVDVFLFGVRS